MRREVKDLVITLRRRMDFNAARRKLMSSPSTSSDEKLLLKKVSLVTHPKDDMYVRTKAEHYLNVGISALRCVNAAVEGMGPIRTVLDLPCGYGRVMRFMKMRFPDAAFTACELNPEPIEFCKSKFSAEEGVISNPNPALIPIAKKFDLIWCGSLVTHLDRPQIEELLRFFYNHLEPEGVCVFTTQGERTAERMEQNIYDYGLSLPSREAVLKDYRADGFGYVTYSDSSSYGVTLISRPQMSAIASSVGTWRETLFIPRGWDDHQDVYAFSKRQIPAN